MRIRIGFDIAVGAAADTPLILALSPHPDEEHRLLAETGLAAEPATPIETFGDAFGNRRARLVARAGTTRLRWQSAVRDDGFPDEIDWFARQHRIEELPPETLQFLAPSRYCESDLLADEAWRLFGQAPEGWARVQAICDHVHSRIAFGYQHARPTKTAYEAWCERRGVCRDFAHVAITFCRAMNIPARYVSGYLGDIGVPPAGPGDFCAWFEAYLDGRWHTFDARYNVPRIGRVRMVRGRDAADVPMISSFGVITLDHFEVWCDEIAEDGEPTLVEEAPPTVPLVTEAA
jgi:transglutaminase-like putative cysteine protease